MAVGFDCVTVLDCEVVVDGDLLPELMFDAEVVGVFAHRGTDGRTEVYVVHAPER